jgi:adenylate cyclase
MAEIQPPTKEQIKEQLAKIIASEDFQRSVRSSDFLTYIVQKTLDGHTELIKGYTIGVEVFGKPEAFDPDTDASVRVEASRLRKSLTLYYHQAGKNDEVVITVPKGRYKPSFEFAIEQEPHTSFRIRDERLCAVSRVLNIALLLLIIVYIMLYSATESSKKPMKMSLVEHAPVIAVLPFNTIGGDNSEAYGKKLPDKIIKNLTYFSSVKVLTNKAVSGHVKWIGANAKIGKELNAGYILEGTIQNKGADVRVVLRLFNVQRNTHVWAFDEEYALLKYGDNAWEDVLAASVASRIASPYGVVQNIEQDRLSALGTNDVIGYQCTLYYYAYSNNKSAEGHQNVRSCLEKNTRSRSCG